MYCVDREKKIHEAAKEKRKDKELVNRRYRRGAAAQEQLEVTGRFNDPQGTDKLQWKSNFNTGWVLLSLCLKAQRHVGPLMTSNCTSSAHHTSTEQRRGCEMVRDYDASKSSLPDHPRRYSQLQPKSETQQRHQVANQL